MLLFFFRGSSIHLYEGNRFFSPSLDFHCDCEPVFWQDVTTQTHQAPVATCGAKNTPWKLTWNPKMEVCKMMFLFNWVMFRFHVNFRGCTQQKCFFLKKLLSIVVTPDPIGSD